MLASSASAAHWRKKRKNRIQDRCMCSYFGWSSGAIKSHVRDLRRDMANCMVAFLVCCNVHFAFGFEENLYSAQRKKARRPLHKRMDKQRMGSGMDVNVFNVEQSRERRREKEKESWQKIVPEEQARECGKIYQAQYI